jgi:malic enzyme
VLALSNPTSKAEVSFEDALAWSGGRAVYASGSPFPPVAQGGASGGLLRPAQANNCFVFSGLAQGLLLQSKHPSPVVDDALLLVVVQTLAGLLSATELEEECMLPRIRRLPEVTAAVAAAVAQAVS